jgi:hypothetical protein
MAGVTTPAMGAWNTGVRRPNRSMRGVERIRARYSLLWVPSQNGNLALRLQPHSHAVWS